MKPKPKPPPWALKCDLFYGRQRLGKIHALDTRRGVVAFDFLEGGYAVRKIAGEVLKELEFRAGTVRRPAPDTEVASDDAKGDADVRAAA